MATEIDVTAQIDGLAASLETFAVLHSRLGERLFEAVPSVSGWSCGQHLYHVALATGLALDNVVRLVQGRSPMIVHEGGPNELAVRVLTEGGYPRGESEAPRMVRPGDEVDPAFLVDEMQLNRDGLTEVRKVADRIPGATGRIRHPQLGELLATEWLRFVNLHASHHLAILRDVESALA